MNREAAAGCLPFVRDSRQEFGGVLHERACLDSASRQSVGLRPQPGPDGFDGGGDMLLAVCSNLAHVLIEKFSKVVLSSLHALSPVEVFRSFLNRARARNRRTVTTVMETPSDSAICRVLLLCMCRRIKTSADSG